MNLAKAQLAAEKVRLLVLDVDGVLTDGSIYYSNNGDELKAFNIQDGLGIKLLQGANIEVAIITGRSSSLLSRRSKELGIQRVIQGREDKLTALNELLADSTYTFDDIAYMGDDLPDLAVIRRVGLGMTVANANPTVIEHAHWQAKRDGGRGAVREAAEFILRAQGKLEQAIAPFL